jgi:hypothetical protein
MSEECALSPDQQHLWVRRRDGKACAYCGLRRFGSSTLTNAERARVSAASQGRYPVNTDSSIPLATIYLISPVKEGDTVDQWARRQGKITNVKMPK